ncbi:MAG: hypothetical protein K2Y35_02075 [Burkholderiales bacterium]|nr:hypothetical protein [Burkholderiales bacterium]
MFERLAAALFGGTQGSAAGSADAPLVAELIEAIVEAVEPRIRHRARYQQKLDACVRLAIAHLREMARVPLEPITLTRRAWSSDPHVNAFFATADDVPECLGRSRELRAFFADPVNREVAEAFGLLAMRRTERTVFAPQLQGDTVRHDVPQVTVSFSDHRLIAPGATPAATRVEVGRRIMQRLAQVALGRIIAVDMKATELQERKAYLGARLRMLKLAADGMESLVSDPATVAQQIKETERELESTVEGYIDAKASLATLDGYIDHVHAVFGHPEQHVQLVATPLRVTRLGVKVEDDAAGPVNDLTLTELAIGAEFKAVIALVRCPRSELPPEVSRLAQGERYL